MCGLNTFGVEEYVQTLDLSDYRKFYIRKYIKNNPLNKAFKVRIVWGRLSVSAMIAGLVKMCVLRVLIFSTETTDFNLTHPYLVSTQLIVSVGIPSCYRRL